MESSCKASCCSYPASVTSLYICYQSIREPLTWTQVVAYLEGLVRAEHLVFLMTFEPEPLSATDAMEWRNRLSDRRITWRWLRYHKRPRLPATAWDIAAGVVLGWQLVRRFDIGLIHARCHVPGIMAHVLKKLTGAKFLFDLRGFMAEEYADAGVWQAGGVLFRLIKRAERALVRSADAIVVLTGSAKEILLDWYRQETNGKRITVIPCCVDFRKNIWPASRWPESGAMTLVYAGKLGGWYLNEAMVEFVAAARELIPGLRWRVWTQSDPTELRELVEANGLDGCVAIGRLPPEEVAREIGRADGGIAFIKPCLSKKASSPTKVGEYLAAGLPVISTAEIGDTDALLAGNGSGSVGALARELSAEGYRNAAQEWLELLRQPGIRERCRAAAKEHLDLERIGWARYREIYRFLTERP